jgi:hypothetical protein
MRSYQLTITSARDPSCTRSIAFCGAQSLGEVHGAIQREFELDDDHMFAFFLSGEEWDKESEFKGDPQGGGRAYRAALDSLSLEPAMRFLYVFDFGDCLAHEIDVVDVGEADGGDYPRVLARTGTPPEQYADEEDASDADAEPVGPPELPAQAFAPELLERVRGAVDALDDDDEDEDGDDDEDPVLETGGRDDIFGRPGDDGADYDPEQELAIAKEVLAACPATASLAALEEAVDAPVASWLMDTAYQLACSGHAHEAMALAEELDTRAFDPDWAELAVCLALEGASELAAAALAHLARPPRGTALQRYRIAKAHVAVCTGELVQAEAALREVLAERWPGRQSREEAVLLLGQVLVSSGRKDEARKLAKQAREAEVERIARAEAEGGTVRHTEPKVGANEPCPCGSGKKHKKCCGA